MCERKCALRSAKFVATLAMMAAAISICSGDQNTAVDSRDPIRQAELLEKQYCASPEVVRLVRAGDSYTQVTNTLRVKGLHQFTVKETSDSNTFMCVEFRFVRPSVRYYALFRNGKFAGFINPPAYEEETIVDSQGNRRSVFKKIDRWARINKVLTSPRLTGDTIAGVLKKGLSARKQDNDVSWILKLPIIRQRFQAEMRQMIKGYAKNDQLAARYDATKLQIGMTRLEVHAIFGEPDKQTRGESGRQVDIFMLVSPQNISPIYFLSPFGVEYEDERVIGVFSAEYLCGQ